MKRRNFLHYAASSLVLPVLVDGFGARAYARPSSFVQSLVDLAAQSDRVLVIIQLQGGNDGLNTVIPLDQMSVYTAPTFRKNIAIPEGKALRLKNYEGTGLHPAMTGMQQLFNDGRLSIVQGVSDTELLAFPRQRHLDDSRRRQSNRHVGLGRTLPEQSLPRLSRCVPVEQHA